MPRGWWRGFCVILAPGTTRAPGFPLETLQGSKPANRVRTQTSCSTTKTCSPIESRPLASRLGAWPLAAGFTRVGQRRARVASAQFPPTPPRQTCHHTPNDVPRGKGARKPAGIDACLVHKLCARSLRARTNSPSPEQRQIQAGTQESSSFLPDHGQIRRSSHSLAIVKTRVAFALAGERAISRILAGLGPARWFGGREMLTLLLVRLICWLSLVIRTAGEVSR